MVIITQFMGERDFEPYLHFTGGLIVNYEDVATPDEKQKWIESLNAKDAAIAKEGWANANNDCRNYKQLYEEPIPTKEVFKSFFKEIESNPSFVQFSTPDPRLKSRVIDMKIPR